MSMHRKKARDRPRAGSRPKNFATTISSISDDMIYILKRKLKTVDWKTVRIILITQLVMLLLYFGFGAVVKLTMIK